MLDPYGDLADLFQAVVDVESVSGNERALADAVDEALRACPHLDVRRTGQVIVARTTLGRDQRVVLAGHLDTVPLAANLPSRWEERDGERVLWGRGSVDMKGGVAVMVALAAQVTRPRFDLTWLFYDNEEVDAEANGLNQLARSDPSALQGDCAVLLEPTAARIEGGCQGTLRVALRTTGQAAHSARSWTGHNAIHDLARALVILQTFQAPRVMVDGLEYREGLNAVRVSGGIAGNVVPDRAELHVNYRFAPDKQPADALAICRDLFAGYDVTVLDAAPGARPGLDAAVLQDLVTRAGGEAVPKFGWTDVARFAALGIPAINFGPGDANLAHSDDEHCPLAQVERCHAVLEGWLNPPRQTDPAVA